MNIINYLTAHWSDIITALTSVIIAARIIVKLTPTPKDDTMLDSIVEGLKHIGLVVKDKAPLLLTSLFMLTLTSCGTAPDGEKTFIGITGQGWLNTGKAALVGAVPVALDERAKASAKNPVKITP